MTKHSTRFEDLPARYQKQAAEQGVKPATPLGKLQAAGHRQSKHKNVHCDDDAGRAFDSLKELRDFHQLVLYHGIENVIRQVSIPLDDRPPIQRMRPDFLIIEELFDDGSFRGRLLDSKGYATPDWKRKAKALEMRHGLIVETI